MSCKVTSVFLSAILLLLGCAAITPKLEDPEVKIVALRTLPIQGLEQPIAIDLSIKNPNKKELTIRRIAYSIGIENIKLLSGVSDHVPTLKSNQETLVTLEVSLNIVQGLRLIEYFSKNGVNEKIHYSFAADIDFSAWLPTKHIDKKGELPLNGKHNEKP